MYGGMGMDVFEDHYRVPLMQKISWLFPPNDLAEGAIRFHGSNGVNYFGNVAQIPGANIKEFLVTILSEVKRPQIQCLSLKGEFWICSEASSRMVKNSFQ
jgi:hypothetical protein